MRKKEDSSFTEGSILSLWQIESSQFAWGGNTLSYGSLVRIKNSFTSQFLCVQKRQQSDALPSLSANIEQRYEVMMTSDPNELGIWFRLVPLLLAEVEIEVSLLEDLEEGVQFDEGFRLMHAETGYFLRLKSSDVAVKETGEAASPDNGNAVQQYFAVTDKVTDRDVFSFRSASNDDVDLTYQLKMRGSTVFSSVKSCLEWQQR